MKTKSATEVRSLIDQINEKHPTFTGQIRAVAAEGEKADEQPVFKISISSEAPYERWFGMEILGHKEGEVDMSWLRSGNAPLLLQHDHSQLIGKIESAKLEGGRVTATVRFGRSSLAQEIRQDVEDGIRTNISVGYRVNDMELTAKGQNGAPDEYRVNSWMPFEASSVSVPADMTVGTNRSTDAVVVSPEQIQIKDNTMDLKAAAKALGLSEDASLESILAAKATQAEKSATAKADAELKRQSDIRSLADLQRGKITKIDERAKAAIDHGKSAEAFTRDIMDAYTDGETEISSAPAYSAQDKKDISGFSITKAIREFGANGGLTGVEREVHEQAEKEARDSGLTISGFGIPASMMRAGEVTVAGEGADTVATGITGFIELLRNKMIVNQLGARSLTGLTSNVLIPKMTAGASAAWEGEIDAGSKATQTFGQLALSPKRVGAYTEISKQLILQSSPDVEALIRDDLATAIAIGIDAAALHGTGTNDQPTGIAATSGIGSVVGGTNGAAPDWADIVNLESAVAVDNADVGMLAYCTNAAVRGKLKQTAKVASTDSNMVWAAGATPLNGYGCGVSNQVSSGLTKGSASGTCSAIFFGNWSDLIVAQFGGLDLVVDPYSLATTNLLRVTANTYADVGVRHAESFAAMLDALTA